MIKKKELPDDPKRRILKIRKPNKLNNSSQQRHKQPVTTFGS